jgi:hypothetical protein
VIAIFAKFDDLISQVYDRKLGEDENREVAIKSLEAMFRAPLSKFTFPPTAYLRLEGAFRIVFSVTSELLT